MPTKIIGNAPYQVPRNADLGQMAYQDRDNVIIDNGAITAGASATQGYFQDTDVSETAPSLNLDFVNGKVLDPRIIFSRGTTGLYYDGRTEAYSGGVNHYAWSNNFSQWTYENLTWTSNAAQAPDGTMTAWKATENSTNAAHRVYSYTEAPVVSGTKYAISAYLKYIGRRYVQFNCDNSKTGCRVIFDIQNGVVSDASIADSAYVINCGNGWYRCVVIITATTNTATTPIGGNSTATGNGEAYAGLNGDAYYIWNIQREFVSVGDPTITDSTYVYNPVYTPTLQTAAINGPRFDHDPITGESKGLLIEQNGTNLVVYSQDLTQATAWNTLNSTIYKNIIIAPDGTMTGNKIVETTANGQHECYTNSMAISSGITYTYSVYLKAGEVSSALIQIKNMGIATWNNSVIDLTNNKFTTVGTNLTAASTAVGNGWYRVTLTATSQSTATDFSVKLYRNTNSYVGDGASGLYVWGVQLEIGNGSSYVATSGSSATRSVDLAYVPISVSSTNQWYNFEQGTLVADFDTNAASVAGTFAISEGVGNNQIDYRAAQAYMGVYNSGSGSNFSTPSLANGTRTRVGIAFKSNDFFAIFSNPYGSYYSARTSSTMKVPQIVNRIWIGNIDAGSWPLGGHMRKLTYYPTRISNAELTEITL